MDVGDGTLTLHAHIEGKINYSRLKYFQEIWLRILLGLWERGSKTVETWIDYDNTTQRRFAEFFGFESTGFLKLVKFPSGQEFLMEEMVYVIPLDDDEDYE